MWGMKSAGKTPGKNSVCGDSAAFLLAQLGAHAASRFAERLAAIGLTPPDAGLMKKIGAAPGISQQALAEHLHVLPSRMVVLLDVLEQKGLIERASSPNDRRSYALRLTPLGARTMGEIGQIAAEHERSLCAALSETEKNQLTELCARIAAQQGLTPGVHPGYRQIGAKKP
jgi:DNA-binding MarR family transcriptional regulator